MAGVLNGFAVIVVLVALGWILARTGVLGHDARLVLNRLVFFVATPALLLDLIAFFKPLTDFSTGNLDESLKAWIQGKGLGMGQVMNTLRLVLVGGSFGPGVAAIASTLGKKEVTERIGRALEGISNF